MADPDRPNRIVLFSAKWALKSEERATAPILAANLRVIAEQVSYQLTRLKF